MTVWPNGKPSSDSAAAQRDVVDLPGRRRQPEAITSIRSVLPGRGGALPRSSPPPQVVEEAPRAGGDFVGTIRQAIETLSSGGYPDIRTTAAFVGVSVRTLQRRLAKAGVNHHVLVAQARFAMAAAVLEQTDSKVLKLALDLGYSDHGNFTRAFRRWAGCPPRQYRLTRVARRSLQDGLLATAQG